MMLVILTLCALAAPPEAPLSDALPLDQGRSIYQAKCQSCHGPGGKGDGPAARALARPPADLSDPLFWKNTDEAVVRSIIASGRAGTVMRGFPMPAERQDALITYLKSLSAR